MNEAMAALSERRSGKRVMIADSDGSSKVMTEAFAELTRHESRSIDYHYQQMRLNTGLVLRNRWGIFRVGLSYLKDLGGS